MSKNSRRTLAEKEAGHEEPDMLVSESMRDCRAAAFEHLGVPWHLWGMFWFEFFSAWMVSKKMSVFGQQDDGLVYRPPDLVVGQWTDLENRRLWDGPTPFRIFLAVSFHRQHEDEKVVKQSLVDWATKYLEQIRAKYQEIFNLDARNSDDGDSNTTVYPREYTVSVWVADTYGTAITFYKCQSTFVYRDHGDSECLSTQVSVLPVYGKYSSGKERSFFTPEEDGLFLQQILCAIIDELRFERDDGIYRFKGTDY